MVYALPPLQLAPLQGFQALLSGLLLGITLAMPLGPTGMEVLHNSMRHGFWVGLAVGTGAIIADACYLLFVQFGLVPYLQLPWVHLLFGLASAAVLIILGISLLRSPGHASSLSESEFLPDVSKDEVNPLFSQLPGGLRIGSTTKRAVLNGLLLTGLNPLTLTLWVGVGTTAIASWNSASPYLGMLFILGILFGQELWFATISRLARTRFFRWQRRWLPYIQKACGIAMLVVAAWTLWTLFI
ncbi:LysE family translocator [Heliophilum fasciatum]|uniref:Threonine/homoserine/homoserine lactone efflux protein n=1 Tax=Heliophilum fasciatum TaxID=35700 RepID=A0A4R2S0Z0_9FIRM|nr:LysE family transporter [Heliophilum fasciatum]MCW2276742.1 threonine/homoserine/homoserine lactone efflux protein [Heliophilum fasciatum]TCP68877.1 threonine/homoserine/homoserine lactone efflux protein [Heliophilum fasciatum]